MAFIPKETGPNTPFLQGYFGKPQVGMPAWRGDHKPPGRAHFVPIEDEPKPLREGPSDDDPRDLA